MRQRLQSIFAAVFVSALVLPAILPTFNPSWSTAKTIGGTISHSVDGSGDTLTTTDPDVVIVACTATGALNLPDASDAGAGRRFLVCADGTVDNATRVAITRAGTDTIQGATTALVISTPYTVCELTSDGVSDWIVTRWVPGAPSAYTVTGSTWTTNTTISAKMEQPAPRVVTVYVLVAMAGVPDTATLEWDAAPPGFTVDETNDPQNLTENGPVITSSSLDYFDSGTGHLAGGVQYLSATDDVRPGVQDEAAASTFYQVNFVEGGTDTPVTMANNDRIHVRYTLRVQ